MVNFLKFINNLFLISLSLMYSFTELKYIANYDNFQRYWPVSIDDQRHVSSPENAKMYWKEFMHQCSEIGIGSLGIVAIISVLSVRFPLFKRLTS